MRHWHVAHMRVLMPVWWLSAFSLQPQSTARTHGAKVHTSLTVTIHRVTTTEQVDTMYERTFQWNHIYWKHRRHLIIGLATNICLPVYWKRSLDLGMVALQSNNDRAECPFLCEFMDRACAFNRAYFHTHTHTPTPITPINTTVNTRFKCTVSD